MLLDLLGVEAQLDAGLRRRRAELLERGLDVVGPAVGDDGHAAHGVAHGSTVPAAAAGSAAPGRAPSANHTKVSRFPFGPGSPDDAKP